MAKTYRHISTPLKVLGPVEMEEIRYGVVASSGAFFLFFNPMVFLAVLLLTVWGLMKVKAEAESGILYHVQYSYLGVPLKGYLPPKKITDKYTVFKLKKNRRTKIFNECRRPVFQ